jgi:response regulator NasT
MSLKIMLVEQDSARSAILEQALHDAGHRVVARIGHGRDWLRELEESQPDILIMDLDAPGRDILDRLRDISRNRPRPIILFSNERDGDYIHQAVKAGVSAYVVDGLGRERVMPIVEAAVARFREFEALKRELQETKTRLADRKMVDKAKGILMQRKGIGEDEAYRLLRKTAMSRNLRIADVARALLALEGLAD